MDQLRQRLIDFTEPPPPGVWEQVESALDQELPSLSKKLSAFTSAPPTDLWNNIEAGLDGKKETAKVLPFRKLIRIAAAAVILIGVFMTVRLFTPDGSKDQITSAPTIESPLQDQQPPKETDPQNADPVEKKSPAIAKTFIKIPEPSISDKTPKKTRYTTMSNDEGQTVRLSKKVAPVFDCAGAKIKSVSARCKEDIKALQEKIGSSFTSPSADFSGLIDILKSLEGDQ